MSLLEVTCFFDIIKLTLHYSVMKPDQKTILAGRIARAAAVFCVDEIVVFDDSPSIIPNYISPHYRKKNKTKAEVLDSISENDEPWQNPDQFLYHVLSYAECPPHLRTDRDNPNASLFPQHQNLQWAGQLPSLDMPHHLKSHEWCPYREGVTIGPATETTTKKGKAKSATSWTYVKCGLPYPVKIPVDVPANMRITLKFVDPEQPPSWPHLSQQQCENLEVEAVAPSAPREEGGYYWGYSVRRAQCLSQVFTMAEYQGGYDISIGTSERGVSLNSVLPAAVVPSTTKRVAGVNLLPSQFNHLLVVFGGVAGLEPAVANDPEFMKVGLTKERAHETFDAWVNLVQGQGSRTIRTEEAVEFGLFGLKEYVDSMYEE
jgi:methyltransferase